MLPISRRGEHRLSITMTDSIPRRRELRRRVLAGASHEELRQEVETDTNRAGFLRRMASIQVRAPSWWERLLGAWLLFFWAFFALVYLVDLISDLDGANASKIAGSLLGVLLAIQVWLRNGAAYGAGAAWIVAALALDWWQYAESVRNGDASGVSGSVMIVATGIVLATAMAMVVLQRRLYPHVTFTGRHRASPERRIMQF
jgi:hypothetical protein